MSTEIEVKDPLKITYPGKKGQILEMLGSGLGAESVATALGVSPSLVSQLLSIEEFAQAVTARRFSRLTKHNERDDKLDALEDESIKKLQEMLSMVYKPMEVLRIFQVINAAKRRGSGADAAASTVINNQVVNLVLPAAIKQTFHADSNNQVVEVIEGAVQEITEQRHSLVTMPAAGLAQFAAQKRTENDTAKIRERVGTLLDNKSATAAEGSE